MIKNIDGIIYDTDKAKKLGDFKNHHAYFETLYITQDEHWFIVCTTRKVISYSAHTYIDEIKPITAEMAKDWLLTHSGPLTTKPYFDVGEFGV